MSKPIGKKRNRLQRMVISEVSLCDSPASPGAVVVLAKRATGPMMFDDVVAAAQRPAPAPLLFDDILAKRGFDEAAHPRDDHGRFANGGTGAGAGGGKPTLQHQIKAIGRKARAIAVDALRSVSASAKTMRLQHVRPVQGGGVEFGVHGADPKGRPVRVAVQLKPGALGGKLDTGLARLHQSLRTAGSPEVEPGQAVTLIRPGGPAAVTKEGTTMQKRDALPLPVGELGGMTKEQVWDQIQDRVADQRLPNESFADALGRLQKEDPGMKTLSAAYETAPTISQARDAETRRQANQHTRGAKPMAGDVTKSATLRTLETMAADIRKSEPGLTAAQAFVKAASSPTGEKLYALATGRG